MDKHTTGCQYLPFTTAVYNAASFRQQNTGVSRKHNSLSSNFQAPADKPMYKQISQKMILKWILRKNMGWYQQDLSCSEKEQVVGLGP